MSDISWKLEEEDIEWEMDWSAVPLAKAKGKPDKEMIFEHAKALAHLIMNDVCLVHDHWWHKEFSEEDKKSIGISIICSDTFAYASADSENLPYNQIETVYRMWKKDPIYGPTAWCVMQRKERPIAPVEKWLRNAGYDIDSWLLNENVTNAQVQALFADAAAAMKAKKD